MAKSRGAWWVRGGIRLKVTIMNVTTTQFCGNRSDVISAEIIRYPLIWAKMCFTL